MDSKYQEIEQAKEKCLKEINYLTTKLETFQEFLADWNRQLKVTEDEENIIQEKLQVKEQCLKEINYLTTRIETCQEFLDEWTQKLQVLEDEKYINKFFRFCQNFEDYSKQLIHPSIDGEKYFRVCKAMFYVTKFMIPSEFEGIEIKFSDFN